MEEDKNTKDLLWTYHHVKIKPHEQIGIHNQNTWELSYIIKGQGERVIDGETASFSEKDLVLVVPKAEHGWIFDPEITDADGNIECISLRWSSELFSHLEMLFPAWTEVKNQLLAISQCAVFDTKQSSEIVDKLLLLDQCGEEQFPIYLLDLFLSILKGIQSASRIKKKLSIADTRLKQIEIYTSCNFSRSITLSDVSQHVGMNRSAFCTFFRRETGESYMTYLKRYRLNFARQLIEHTGNSISSICWQCGFNDLGYFDRIFRNEFGFSPTDCRKQAESLISHTFGCLDGCL